MIFRLKYLMKSEKFKKQCFIAKRINRIKILIHKFRSKKRQTDMIGKRLITLNRMLPN